MKKENLFISDLHIAWDKPEITQRFLRFLDNRAIKASALYVLGDLFDAWVGDDDSSPPNPKIRESLKRLTESGTKIYFQQGNRDFLLGDRFCDATGIILLDDPVVIDLFGVPTLLMHGDLLCTDDLPYQEFRSKSRSPEWQQGVLSKPLFVRLLAARWYRIRSYFHKRKKTQEIMDVNQGTVTDMMTKFNCLRLIHGHTHRPNIHNFEINGKPAQRYVLAAWTKDKGEALVWDENGCHVEVV
ncbi:UDP-2,3-diacylglucosamine diphosphatase [Methyloglobulus sp.]|uniref:UDP-2,3-diacylglucosamine diphosphatase n=1 Tax=Methyloglobulus sp. TaxID=2518622 RepID=UPI0032B7D2AF